jgi:hypothetical protein
MASLSAVPRWRLTSVALAGALVAIPVLQLGAGNVYGPVEGVAVIGLAIGWIAFDRLAALRLPLWGFAAVVLATLVAGPWLASRASAVLGLHLGPLRGTTLVVSFVFGGLVRGWTADRRSMASLVALAGAFSWLMYDVPQLPYRPLRDLLLYLDAGTTALHGTSPYIHAAVLRPVGVDLPFVYPPLTIPLFELLAAIPRPVAEAIWVGATIAAVVAGLWLLGVRGRWLLALLAWPPLALGIAVGNVASFNFFLYVAGFRVGASLFLSGLFKPQSTIPALWLVREGRWRQIATGIGIVVLLALIALPLTGLNAWIDWLSGLRYFQDSFAASPSMQGLSFSRWLGALAVVLTAVSIGVAFVGRGRNGLARFGLAGIVSSPTLYVHGLSPLLAGALGLGPELLWFVLGLGPWRIGIPSAWLAMGLVGLALLVRRGNDLRLPNDLSPARADLHPLGAMGQVWPREADDLDVDVRPVAPTDGTGPLV